MKRKILLLTLLLFCFAAYSADLKIKRTPTRTYVSSGQLYLSKKTHDSVLCAFFNKCLENDTTNYDMSLIYYSYHRRETKKGNKVFITLGNEDIITLVNKSGDYGIYSRLTDNYSSIFYFDIKEYQIKKILELGVKNISLYDNTINIKPKIKKGMIKHLRKLIKLDLL